MIIRSVDSRSRMRTSAPVAALVALSLLVGLVSAGTAQATPQPSTIMGLLSMLALDAHPDVAAAATARNKRVGQLSWTLLEAEGGKLSGSAQVVTPASAWTGESLWSGGKYVQLLPGSQDTVTATLPEAGRYRVLPVFDRQEAPLDSIGLRFKLANRPLGVLWQGGAGAQGVSRPLGISTSATSAPTS